MAGTCGIPSEAKAISVNIAVTGATAPGNLRLHPGGSAVPLVSSINYSAGQTRSNNLVVAPNDLGELAAFVGAAGGTVHLILDVNGYFAEVASCPATPACLPPIDIGSVSGDVSGDIAFDLIVEVRHVAGSCDPSLMWTLRVDGNVVTNNRACNP